MLKAHKSGKKTNKQKKGKTTNRPEGLSTILTNERGFELQRLNHGKVTRKHIGE